MKPSEVLRSHRDAIRKVVESHRALNARLFGSVLHGDDSATSDLDVLVDALPGATLFDLGAIQVELEEVLGIPVDVNSRRCTNTGGPAGKISRQSSRGSRSDMTQLPRQLRHTDYLE